MLFIGIFEKYEFSICRGVKMILWVGLKNLLILKGFYGIVIYFIE